jgi:uncharacterized membrane protein
MHIPNKPILKIIVVVAIALAIINLTALCYSVASLFEVNAVHKKINGDKE